MSLNWHCQLRKLSCGLRELHPFLTLRWTSQWVLYLELKFMWKKDVIHRLYQIIFSQHPIPSRSKQRSIFEVFSQFESFSRFWSKRFRSDCFMGSLKLLVLRDAMDLNIILMELEQFRICRLPCPLILRIINHVLLVVLRHWLCYTTCY